MSTRLSAPKDGIVASARPKGWAAESWMVGSTAFIALAASSTNGAHVSMGL